MGRSILRDMALGAAAGLLGTMALQGVRAAEQKWIPGGSAPIKKDPGRFMIEKAADALPVTERTRQQMRRKGAQGSKLLSVGYGMTFGLLYAVARPRTRRLFREGILLGIGAWAVGFLGWLPAAGLMEQVWKQKPKQIATPVADHALFGLATVTGSHLLRKLF